MLRKKIETFLKVVHDACVNIFILLIICRLQVFSLAPAAPTFASLHIFHTCMVMLSFKAFM